MATADDVNLQNWGLIIGLCVTVAGTIYAGLRTLYCKGKSEEHRNNEVKLLTDRMDGIVSKFEKLKDWAEREHEEMNESTKLAFEKLETKIDTVNNDIHDIRGYLKRLSEEK